MAVKLANNAVSTLAASITDAATEISVQVADAGKFPTFGAGDWHPATLVDASGNMEIVRVTARAANVLTVTRAQEGTTAKAFVAGTRIDIRLTAGAFAAKANDADLSTVAKSGAYGDLSGKPVLGTAASKNIGDFATATQGAKADTAIQPDAIDPWAFQPIGLPLAVNMGIAGWSAPPRNKGYRYIVLTAGQTTAGLYNEGVLVSENVSGSDPYINAFATINLAGSPLNGGVVALINTSREFMRPGNNPGAQEDSQNLLHGHSVFDPGHSHGLDVTVGNSGSGGAFGVANPAANETPTSRGSARSSGTGVSISGSGNAESRPRNRTVQFYMRIL